jgi:hypothetical protein
LVLVFWILTILSVWTASAIVIAGIGSLVLRASGAAPRIFYSFWVGFGAVVALLDGWNLFLPIHAAAPISLAIVGLCGIFANHATLHRDMARLRAAFRWPAALAWAALIVFIALRLVGPCDHPDTGFYGATAVRWITTYPTVPGLANLYGRLGFNTSLFPFVAALEEATSRTLGFRLATGFTLAALWSSIFPSCVRVCRRESATLVDWFFAITAMPTVIWATRDMLVGMATDEPAAAASLLGAGLLVAALTSLGSDDEPSVIRARTITWAVLLATGIALKESTIVFAALAWLVGFFLTSWPKQKREKIFASVVPVILISVPWVARSIILSGYPFYPSTFLGVHASWTVPPKEANFYAAWIRAAARIPFAPVASTQGTHWISVWLMRELRDRMGFQVPMLISVAGAAIVCIFGRGALGRQARGAWLLVASIPGLIFWFVEAPDPRFGEAAIWTTAALLGSLGIVTALARWHRVRPSFAWAGLALLTFWCLFSYGWRVSYQPALSANKLEPLPSPKLVSRRAISGLVVSVPMDARCWDAPLPCTPYFDPTIRLRSPRNMRWGFTSQGVPEYPPY